MPVDLLRRDYSAALATATPHKASASAEPGRFPHAGRYAYSYRRAVFGSATGAFPPFSCIGSCDTCSRVRRIDVLRSSTFVSLMKVPPVSSDWGKLARIPVVPDVAIDAEQKAIIIPEVIAFIDRRSGLG